MPTRSRWREPLTRFWQSFICYLNEPGWTAADGGALRIFSGGEDTEAARRTGDAAEASSYDVLPESGKLVLFDSKEVRNTRARAAPRPPHRDSCLPSCSSLTQVWHEVMPTLRERACLVGWFLNAPA